MIASHKLYELLPEVREKAEKHIACCEKKGVDLFITSTFRDYEAQHALYLRGRELPGPIVTNADAGHSFHNFRCAYDVVPVVAGKPFWTSRDASGILTPEWQIIVDCGKEAGLEWAGEWKTFKEEAHFQYTGGLTLAQLREGKGQVIA